jgi:acyl-CoA thioester hydrolase
MEVEIFYEDTDCGGVVYYANYLRYFERARTKFLTDKNISLSRYHKEGIIFTVVNATVDYHSPAVYGDRLSVETKIDGVKRSSFTVHYEIRRKSDNRLMVTGSTRMACVNDKMKPTRIPTDIRNALP